MVILQDKAGFLNTAWFTSPHQEEELQASILHASDCAPRGGLRRAPSSSRRHPPISCPSGYCEASPSRRQTGPTRPRGCCHLGQRGGTGKQTRRVSVKACAKSPCPTLLDRRLDHDREGGGEGEGTKRAREAERDGGREGGREMEGERWREGGRELPTTRQHEQQSRAYNLVRTGILSDVWKLCREDKGRLTHPWHGTRPDPWCGSRGSR